MAHIIDFTIEGLAGRTEVYKHKLNRDINIFFGLNGSGKTSLLRILDSAMDGDAARIRMVPFKTAEVTIYSADWKKEFVRRIKKPSKSHKYPKDRKELIPSYIASTEDVTGQLYFEFPAEFEEFKWEMEPKPTNPTYKGRWSHIYLPTWRLYGGTYSGSLSTSIERPTRVEREYDWDRYFAEKLENLWRTYSNLLLSDVRKIQEEGIASMLQSIVGARFPKKKQNIKDTEMVYTRVTEFLKRQRSTKSLGTLNRFQNKYSKEPLFSNVIDDIDRIEQQIEAATASRYQLEALIKRMFTGNKAIQFLDTGINVKAKTGEDIGLASLSSGEKHVLGMFIETLLANINTLLIDEPELSLHIDWQKDLISSMSQLNSRAQLILATHSPEITANVSDKNIFNL